MTTSSTRRGVKSPIYDVGDSVVAYHQSTVEETAASSWSAQIGRLRESFECQHAQYLATTNNHSPTDENEHDEMRIRVIVRKRPMSHRESIDGGEVDVVQPLVYHDYGRVLIHQPKTKLDLTKEVETTSFAFDNAFDEDSNNIDIYEQAVQGLIPGLFRGKWASVFAYGQTGSGKTVREICHELQCIA
jgi:kinesin family protein 2/24